MCYGNDDNAGNDDDDDDDYYYRCCCSDDYAYNAEDGTQLKTYIATRILEKNPFLFICFNTLIVLNAA